jgi:hypothetical protein
VCRQVKGHPSRPLVKTLLISEIFWPIWLNNSTSSHGDESLLTSPGNILPRTGADTNSVTNPLWCFFFQIIGLLCPKLGRYKIGHPSVELSVFFF